MSDFKIKGVDIFTDPAGDGVPVTTIGKGLSILSNPINLAQLKAEGFNGMQLISDSAGSGATILAQVVVCATEDGTYTVPKVDATEVANIVTAHADGQNYYAFPAFPIAPFMKVKLTENDIEDVTAFENRLTTQ